MGYPKNLSPLTIRTFIAVWPDAAGLSWKGLGTSASFISLLGLTLFMVKTSSYIPPVHMRVLPQVFAVAALQANCPCEGVY